MKSIYTNPKQIARNIAVIVKHNARKREQLERVQDICLHLTSSDELWVDIEYYGNGLVRYLIGGTRCGMTITAVEPQHKIIRKPRGMRPIFIGWEKIYAHEIFNILEEME